MNQRRKTLQDRVTEAVATAATLAPLVLALDWNSRSDVEAASRAVSAASSRLNGAAHRLRRIARQQNKSGAAGAVQHTRK